MNDLVNIKSILSYRPQLANNKNVQDKLRTEVSENCDAKGKVNFETLNDMPYLDQVWHETLRMHSPAAFVGRVCTESVTLEFDHQKALIEKGINVYIPIHQLHFDPKYYPEPESFKPERFDPEYGGLKAFKDKGVYLPFGDGPRVCLGMKFANMQSKAAIAGIVKNFKLSVNQKTAKKLILDPKEFLNIKVGGLWLDFESIN